MIMRKKPLRGEKYVVNGEEVTVLEVMNDGHGSMVNVLLPNGKMDAVPKSALNLLTIDTNNFEKA